MGYKFENAFDYKIIYVFTLNLEEYKGLVKIGDATLKTDKDISELAPDSHDLNQAARERIKQYTTTAGLEDKVQLLHTELAVHVVKDREGNPKLKAFRDHEVHSVLKNSNIMPKNMGQAKEWYEVDLNTAIAAIKAVKDSQANLSGTSVTRKVPIVFRPEQLEAIDKTVKQFKKGDRMLWNAKMRFGKTLSALEVIKQCKFKKTIIATHRPVVNEGWYDDFTKIFTEEDNYLYGSKKNGYYDIDRLLETGKNFVYFASIQDLRGSSVVNGTFDKNNTIFDTVWDCVIVDEAHEGTQTLRGDKVISALLKDQKKTKTKFLALSGTPFNILGDFEEDAIYTWDYIMEQESKEKWDINHFGDSNPYEELPELKIYTYDLGDILAQHSFISLEDKAFNFKEFFRTWTGSYEIDHDNLPVNKHIGDFVHENDVLSFLNLMTKADENSSYPYSSESYRELFKHTLWMVPGVKEARALKNLMMKHPVFGSGAFNIVNVAGDGDQDEEARDALDKVNSAIAHTGKGEYTITLSCGKLTTGVTIREWTAVFMLSGSYSTSAAQYLQTIFRVQSPANIDGKIKDTAYVFDFAPDRTLKMVAAAVAVSGKAGKTTEGQKVVLGKFLNYCPVISISGSKMHAYNVNRLLQQLKRAYAEKAVRNGFDDTSIYNDELLKLTEVDIKEFDELKKIIGKSKAQAKTNDINLNDTGLTDEEYEEQQKLNKKPKKERTKEEQEKLDELNKRKKLRNDAISILRGISIRMPLLIYGADIEFGDDITIDQLPDLVDDLSWKEFMPKDVTKRVFKKFTKYYDSEVFIAAGRQIRSVAKLADSLDPTERVQKIVTLFSCFKNPDKETVLTPWRVVNMQISDTLGGYCFWNDTFNEELVNPRFVNLGDVTDAVFKKDACILEINSKTGLYPLYMSYSIYKKKCEYRDEVTLSIEEKNLLWNETVMNNIFVVCKTPMAKLITQRTLKGYKDIKINAHYFTDLINKLENKSDEFIKKITRESYWKRGNGKMEFDAIVGNPPYQKMDGGHNASSTPVYNYFVEQAKLIKPNYLSMITPARWYIGGRGLDKFRESMLKDKHMSLLVDFPRDKDVFPTVDIAGGLCYFRWDKSYEGPCLIRNISNGESFEEARNLDEFQTLVRDNKAINIVRKVQGVHSGNYMSDTVLPSRPFGIRTNYKPKDSGIPCQFVQRIGKKFADPNDISDEAKVLDKWKFLAPRAPIAGQTDFTKPIGFYYSGNTFIIEPGCCCTESFIVLFSSDSEDEVKAFKSYLFTKTVRFLLLQSVISQDVVGDKFKFVPSLEKYDGVYTDSRLREMWNINEEEWNYIDSRIKEVE